MALVRSANVALLCQTNNAFVTARETVQGVQVAGGYAEFEGHQTWYRVLGDLDVGRADGPAPLVTLHGGPGATHDYLLSMTDLARGGRAVVFYDQTGNGKSTHFPDRGADFYTVGLFARELANFISHLGISDRYHVLGQSWAACWPRSTPSSRRPGCAR
jgi:L-proline amide hydrolase